MKHAGMPQGMWLLYKNSFQKNMVSVLGFDEKTAKRVTAKALPMTYSTQLFKEAISGTPCANARNSAVILALFLAAFLALTLILSHNKLKKDLERIDREAKNRIAEAKATA